jgi:hypothetical protein
LAQKTMPFTKRKKAGVAAGFFFTFRSALPARAGKRERWF